MDLEDKPTSTVQPSQIVDRPRKRPGYKLVGIMSVAVALGVFAGLEANRYLDFGDS